MSNRKEEIYDNQISPLMKQIIEICQGSGIAMFANFDIGSEDDPGLQCATQLPDENGAIPERRKIMNSIARGGSSASQMQMVVERADGSKEFHAFIG